MSTRLAGGKNYMGNWHKEDLIIMKLNNWTKCIHDRFKEKEVVYKTKTCKNEAVTYEEEEEEEEEEEVNDEQKHAKCPVLQCLITS